ncbi:hypothetical protein CYMTET_14199 [Cymbomonas tetramitiformis]|uniref:Helicase ATP-binding domain-containing protein n=1 Tax=Cymbomonas tetramitiformis TaxID=36881 RepID=A0AAE0GGJ6_9CHLO|nr:hypothetical protein CYMTET_14199 [Cymbomonas tetramitiformis]
MRGVVHRKRYRPRIQWAGIVGASKGGGVYDGDTGPEERTQLRNFGRLIITNPDMLHVALLPSHHQFSRLFRNLRYVVLDEAHAYNGVFGNHTALILRRMRRLCCEEYRCDPQFVMCSATVANPREHVQELTGISEVQVVDCDGSPRAEKVFLLWNPPVVLQQKARPAREVPPRSETAEVKEMLKEIRMLETSSALAEPSNAQASGVPDADSLETERLSRSYEAEAINRGAISSCQSQCCGGFDMVGVGTGEGQARARTGPTKRTRRHVKDSEDIRQASPSPAAQSTQDVLMQQILIMQMQQGELFEMQRQQAEEHRLLRDELQR